VTLEELGRALEGFRVEEPWGVAVAALRREWDEEVARITRPRDGRPGQGEVIGVLNDVLGGTDVLINAAGSAPGDLHKLWKAKAPGTYHVEYGYSCMGYEIPAGLGIRLADPSRGVCALVGDATWLMMPSEIATAVQERLAFTVVLVDNHGFASIGALSGSLGSGGFGTQMRLRGDDGQLSGEPLPIDYVANARSLGAHAVRAEDAAALRRELVAARERTDRPTVIVVETDTSRKVPGYESWWDVPVAEVSTMEAVRQARREWEANRARERSFHAE